jgi:periplasmic copper chaperone A
VSPTVTRRWAALAAATVLPLALAACGAGQGAATYHERPTVDGANVTVGTVALRDVRLIAPSGGVGYAVGSDARARLTMVSTAPDSLVGAATDAASAVQIVGPAGSPEPGPVVLSPGVAVSDRGLLLKGLTRPLRPGEYVTVELTFATSGRQQLRVPVELTGSPPAKVEYEVAETDSAGLPVAPKSGASSAE